MPNDSDYKVNDRIKLAEIGRDVSYIKEKVNADVMKRLEAIEELIRDDYVTKAEFDPVKRVVFGVVSLIGIAVIGALTALVIKP